MYRFKFLSKKDCFKLKLIAPKSSSVLPRTIFGWPSTEYLFLVVVAPQPRTHTNTLRPFHIRRTQAVLGIYGGHEDSNSKDTVYCTFVWTQRTTEWNAIRPLGIYHSCDLWWCFQCTKTRAHRIFIRFWISCCRGWLLLLLKTLSLSHSDEHLYSLRWKFIIGCNSTYAFVHLIRFITFAHCTRKSKQRIALVQTIHFQLAACK